MKCTKNCLNCELPDCVLDITDEKNKIHVFISGHCKDIGSRLKEALTNRGLKQVDLARTTGITEAAVSRYIHDRAIPRGEHLVVICETLDISADWLLGLNRMEDRE